jgi:hypothetical protein
VGCLDSSLRWNDEVEIERFVKELAVTAFAWFVFDLKSPAAAPVMI